jgi:uncharacterized protein Usg
MSAKLLNILCFLLCLTACFQHHALTRSRIGRKRAQKGSDKPMSHVRQLQDYRLTTAEILYHLPDHPSVLQSYIWQSLDIAPKYPELHKFLDFWTREIEGTLHSVRVASASLVKPPTVGHVDEVLHLH